MSGGVPQIAGNQVLLSELIQMRLGAHLPHTLLLHGETGCGKKTIAKWFSMLALCEHPDENGPCGRCKPCQLAAEDAHPDILTAEHSGKRMGYLIETVRDIRKEAAIVPNNGSLRLFLFTDADGMSIQAQNALLKSVEEPPAHAIFVFTTETIGALLPTLLSRMTTKAVFPVTRGECVTALLQKGFSEADVQSAVTRFDGNIGKCIAYLEDDNLRQAADDAAKLTQALAAKQEYELLRLLTAAAGDKERLRKTLLLLDVQLRDAAVLSLDGSFDRLGCDRSAAESLSGGLTPRRAMKMHEAIAQALADLEGNVGAALAVTALCAALSQC